MHARTARAGRRALEEVGSVGVAVLEAPGDALLLQLGQSELGELFTAHADRGVGTRVPDLWRRAGRSGQGVPAHQHRSAGTQLCGGAQSAQPPSPRWGRAGKRENAWLTSKNIEGASSPISYRAAKLFFFRNLYMYFMPVGARLSAPLAPPSRADARGRRSPTPPRAPGARLRKRHGHETATCHGGWHGAGCLPRSTAAFRRSRMSAILWRLPWRSLQLSAAVYFLALLTATMVAAADATPPNFRDPGTASAACNSG